MKKLTAAQTKALRYAVNNEFGQYRRPPYGNGLRLAGWRRTCGNLQALGLFLENAHGDYEITDAGRAALVHQSDREADARPMRGGEA